MTIFRIHALALVLAFEAGAVQAQDSLRFDNLGVGVRGFASTSIYAGGGTNIVPLPNFDFSGRADEYSVGVEGIRLRLFEDRGHRLDAMVRPRFSPYDAADSPQLAGMSRDFTADAGLRYAFTTQGGLQFGVIALTEVTGEHQGQEIEARMTQGLGALPVAVFGGVTYRTDDLSNFLYGVRPSEATAGRSAYDPGATTSPFLGVSTLVPVSERWSITGAIRTDFYSDGVTDSPIVTEDMSVSGTLGVLFRF